MTLIPPFLWYDLRRTARTPGFFGWRVLVAALVGLYVFNCLSELNTVLLEEGEKRGWLKLTTHASKYFLLSFLFKQFIIVSIISPAYFASTIAQEKEKRTLEFLLATSQSSASIIMWKFLSRFVSLFVFLILPLPMIAIFQHLSNVEWLLVFQVNALTLATAVGFGSVGMLCSVLCRKSSSAISLASAVILFYLAIGVATKFTTILYVGSSQGGVLLLEKDSTLYKSLEWFNTGNLFAAFVRPGMPSFVMRWTDTLLVPSILIGYLVFWAITTVGCLLASILLLRRHCIKQITEPVKISRSRRLFIVAIPLILALVFPAYIYIFRSTNPAKPKLFFELMAMPGMVAWGMYFLGLAGQTTRAISSEKDYRTLEVLLTTPLSLHEILIQKLVIAYKAMQYLWLYLCFHYAIMLVFGALPWQSVFSIFAVSCLYSIGFSIIGLFCGVYFKNPSVASIFTFLLASLGIGVHLVLLAGEVRYAAEMTIGNPLSLVYWSVETIYSWRQYLYYSSPLSNIYTLSNFDWNPGREFRSIGLSLLGWLVFSTVLYLCSLWRFKRQTGRL
jgi:ABC-type transport system involved in multi-copper enzyme maturation permease subunit